MYTGRKIITAALATAVVAVAAGCSGPAESGDADANAPITQVNQGGSFGDIFTEVVTVPFEEKFGIEVLHDSPSTLAKVQTMVDAGNVSWDVVTLGAGITNDPSLCEKYFITIDEKLVPNLANIGEDLKAPCGVAQTLYGMVLVYNTTMFGDNPPSGWADFFDTKKFPGARAVGNVPGFIDAPIAALLADGVAPEDLYPLDWDRATAKLDTIKDDLVFYESGGASEQILGAGEVAMAIVFSNRGYVASTAGAPYAPVWSQTFLHVTNFLIPKGAPNVAGAAKYINFALEPDIQAVWIERNAQGATNTKVKVSEDPEIRKWTPTAYPDDTFAIDEEYMATHLEENANKWLEWLHG